MPHGFVEGWELDPAISGVNALNASHAALVGSSGGYIAVRKANFVILANDRIPFLVLHEDFDPMRLLRVDDLRGRIIGTGLDHVPDIVISEGAVCVLPGGG
jgi:hypothetical protein